MRVTIKWEDGTDLPTDCQEVVIEEKSYRIFMRDGQFVLTEDDRQEAG